MKILITGANGFIGRNLTYYLSQNTQFEIINFTRQNEFSQLPELVHQADSIIHLAGVNRPIDDGMFELDNLQLTSLLCKAVRRGDAPTPLIFASSTQALMNNDYGASKRSAEEAILNLKAETGNQVHILRLPNVFGKWAKPNYNSVVATFCHNIANGLPIKINQPDKKLELLYIDDLVETLTGVICNANESQTFITAGPTYEITVGELASQLNKFNNIQKNLEVESVGTGLIRALHSTFVSYLPKTRFKYLLPMHSDKRGNFVEMVKTRNSGQISYFTSKPGITRGGHYHNTKTEKFLVIKGKALFRFKNLFNNEVYSLVCSENVPEIVETVPGWAHDITNIGKEDLICMLWANEVFNPTKPDTYPIQNISEG